MTVPRYPDANWLAGLPEGWKIIGNASGGGAAAEFHCSAATLSRMSAYNGTFPTSPSAGRVYRRDLNENLRRALAQRARDSGIAADAAYAEASAIAPENWVVYVVRDETASEAIADRVANPRRARRDDFGDAPRYQVHDPYRWVECSPCPHDPRPNLPPIKWNAPEAREGTPA